jgi:SP family general alpha glucoside:H+ symporter-like MFS transporter
MAFGLSTKSDPSEGVIRNETGTVGNPADYAHLVKDAATADAAEHTMSVRQAFKIHKKAVFWSMALSAALIMEGETPFELHVALSPRNERSLRE